MHRYDIAGLLTVDSTVELAELAYFRTEQPGSPDIRIRVRFRGLGPRASVRLDRSGDSIAYREHLGPLGANFDVRLGTPIEVDASPLLALSPHVLYTNVVEAIIRFVLVSKGYMLLHAAAVERNGEASLLSAQTDTGKTSTVIQLIRERGYGFISDDMSIVGSDGVVRAYPKPMTLSYHTMTRAVDASTLPVSTRAKLQIQSRIHSKSGRSTAKGLSTLNVPILSINSVVQFVVPPPKHHITSMLPTRIEPATRITNVFLMERGDALQEPVDLEAAVDQLMENTDESYSFPPFATLAPLLEIAGLDYAALRAREREILRASISNAPIRRLRVPGHEWSELLPELIEGSESMEPALAGA